MVVNELLEHLMHEIPWVALKPTAKQVTAIALFIVLVPSMWVRASQIIMGCFKVELNHLQENKESLYEDEEFEQRQLAALLVSKHLGYTHFVLARFSLLFSYLYLGVRGWPSGFIAVPIKPFSMKTGYLLPFPPVIVTHNNHDLSGSPSPSPSLRLLPPIIANNAHKHLVETSTMHILKDHF
ncbi:unnamed protein product [Thlaspi arvense]|uniref:Uncharacterized protein n=1 Tax=Thlaspi arvense TaxID=13288 RepID=A0AAU9RRK9_THLAR|nr:unnamed protein product [Thlaspi arvense]